jgi:hypothetical protein
MIKIYGKTHLDDLLVRIGQKLQLDDTRREKAKKSYETINEILINDTDVTDGCDTTIYAQGSYSIDTTVKPIKDGEYDLDFVFRIEKIWNENMDENQILENMKNCIEQNRTYEGKVEIKNRCIRVNYIGDFHLDILPAYPYKSLNSEFLKIPDRKLNKWVDTSPKLFTDWFNNIANNYYDGYMNNKYFEKADIERLPDPVPYNHKPPLKIAVQLLKRYKSIFFSNEEELETQSIIITTLAAQSYDGNNSEIETLKNFITYVDKKIKNNNGLLMVENPNNSNEKFTDKWKDNPRMADAFNCFFNTLRKKIYDLEHPTSQTALYELLNEMFGENASNSAIKEQAEFIKNRDKFPLSVTGYNIEKTIPKNNFFGD